MRVAGESGLLSLAALRAATPPAVPPVSLPVTGAGQATPPNASTAGPPPRVAPFASQTLSALLGLQGAEAPDRAPDAELTEIEAVAPLAEGEEAGETENDLETAEASDVTDSASANEAAEQPVASLDGAGDGDADQEDLEVAADEGSTPTRPPQTAPAQVA